MTQKPESIKNLTIDLRNYRTVPQRKEISAVHAMITIAPDRFWALVDSLLDSGYLPTENIIVLKESGSLCVKEGNRRIAALKLACGILPLQGLAIPTNIETRLKQVSPQWKSVNENVPCAIYESSEKLIVDRIVSLTHAKSQKAGRDPWESVARARHSRDELKKSEPGIDLLESYLKHGKNLTGEQKEKWAGVFYLSVLDEALPKISTSIGATSVRDLVKDYPNKITHRKELEDLLCDIGTEQTGFPEVRGANFLQSYGFPLPSPPTNPGAATGGGSGTGGGSSAAAGTGTGTGSGGSRPGRPVAYSTTDPRSVRQKLKKFHPRGHGRDKLVTILDEAKEIHLDDFPHAFCFLLRCMFELSVKAYFKDHSLSPMNGTYEKSLKDMLKEAANHLTNNQDKNNPLTRPLHGAMSELAKQKGVLSVTSMNHLIHSPTFTTDAGQICTVFHNVFPLLEALNS